MSDLKELESKRQGVFGMMAGSTHPRTGKLITAEKETLRLIELVNDYGDLIERLEAAENRAAELEAQLAELAAQEPVGWGNIEHLMRYGYCSIFGKKDECIGEPNTPLYTRAAPPAPLVVKRPRSFNREIFGDGMYEVPNGNWMHRKDVTATIESACTAAGIKLQIEGREDGA